jgi:D-threo-aldose 1-dehydrogenase
MHLIPLGPAGRSTTQLGFGCSSLMGANGRRASLAMLEAAFDAGIRHFDVAPMYGYGQAESCLGEFLKRHRGAATVTTKYGIPPARNQSLLGAARRIAGPVVKLLPGLKSRLSKAAGAIAHNDARATFTATQARESLDRSLRELGVDRIDVWLLHEVTADELRDDALLRFLEDSVTAGTLGVFGVGSDRSKLDALLATRSAFCRALQFEWSVFDPDPPQAGTLRIQHRALTENFRTLHAALLGDRPARLRWSSQTGADLADPAVLASLMLRASIDVNPQGIVLFSSKSPQHIQQNIRVAEDDALAGPARQLRLLAHSEGSAFLKLACKV